MRTGVLGNSMLPGRNSLLAPDYFALRTDPSDFDIDFRGVGGEMERDFFPRHVAALPGIAVDERLSRRRDGRDKENRQYGSVE